MIGATSARPSSYEHVVKRRSAGVAPHLEAGRARARARARRLARAAHAAVLEHAHARRRPRLRCLVDELVVDGYRADLVLDDDDAPSVPTGEHTIHERRLAAAEEAETTVIGSRAGVTPADGAATGSSQSSSDFRSIRRSAAACTP